MNKNKKLKIGHWALDAERNTLERSGHAVRLAPRDTQLLRCLVSHAGSVVSTQQLIREVWRGGIVSDAAIYQHIHQLRIALGDDARRPRYIETVPRRGYCLTASVEYLDDDTDVLSGRKETRLRELKRAAWGFAAIALATGLGISSMRLFDASSSPAVAAGPPRTIAVLPFANSSPNEANNYLGEGIAEAIIRALALGSGLETIAATSSFAIADEPLSLSEIGTRLGAAMLVVGELTREEDRITVTASLVETDTSETLWSQSFEQQFIDLLDIERDIALAVAGHLAIDATNLERIAAALPRISEMDAYEAYMRGREHMRLPNGQITEWPETDAARAIAYFRRAIAKAPDFALGHVALAEALLRRSLIGGGFESAKPSPEQREEASAALERGLSLAPDLAEAHAARALARRILDRDMQGAEAAYRQAITLNPYLADARHRLGILLWRNFDDRKAEGLAQLRVAARLDPMSAEIQYWLGVTLRQAGSIGEAATAFALAMALDPDGTSSRLGLGLTLSSLGRLDDAVRILQPLLENSNAATPSVRRTARVALAYLFLDLGDYDAAVGVLEPVAGQPSVNVVNIGVQAALARGQIDAATRRIHEWDGPAALKAVYEMIVGHETHALDLYEPFEAQLANRSNLDWGYFPAINAAHLQLRSGNPGAAQMLDAARSALIDVRDGDRYVPGGVYYLLASIDAIEGKTAQALANLDVAVANGWSRHWYAPLDPNLVSLRDNPRFNELIGVVRSEMQRRLSRLGPVLASQ